MKKFTKLFLSCTAVAAITAAVATSAMAAEYKSLTVGAYALDASGTFGTVEIKTETPDDMKTLLVLNKGKDLTDFAPADVLQIDQDGTIATVKLPAYSEENEDHKGTYNVYMGGTSGEIYAGSFTIGATPVLVGDADPNGRITPNDSVLMLQWIAGDKTKIADEDIPKAAYADGNNRITPNDSVEVLKYVAGDKNREFVGKTMVIPE